MPSYVTTVSIRPELYDYAKAEGLKVSEIVNERIQEIKEAREAGEEELTAPQYRAKIRILAQQLREYNVRYLEQKEMLVPEKDVQQ
jgi:hypothetical protein